MRIFRKSEDIDAMRARAADLSSQLVAQKDEAQSITANLHEALINDAPANEISKLESKLADAERRISAISSALVALDQKIAAAEAERAEHEQQEAAERAASDLERNHAEFAKRLDAFVVAASELLPSAAKLREVLFTAGELESLARAVADQIPTTARRLEGEVQSTAAMIRRERPARYLRNAA